MGEGNLGTISFGVEAYTDKLDAAKKKIDAFGKVTTATAKKQVKGHESVVAAMKKQHDAMNAALKATQDLGKEAQKSKASGDQQTKALKSLSAALNSHVAVLSKVKSTTAQVTNAQRSFDASANKAKTSIRDMSHAASAAAKKEQDLADTMRNMESAAVLAIGPLSGLGARIRSLGSIASRSSLRLVVLIGTAVAVGVALAKMSAAALNAFKVFESANARFKAATGSMELARAEMNFVIKTSLELGLRIQDTAKAYSRLTAASKGTELAGQATRKIFLSIAKAAAALRLSQGEVEGAFRAIEQMMSKGTVQAEELRGQLGERLPGAFRLAAEGMKMTTQELGKAMKMGEITATVFLPKLAEAIEKSLGADAASNVDSFTGSMNNLGNRFLLFAQEWDRVTNTSGIFIAAIHGATKGIKLLTGSLEFMVKALISVSLAMLPFAGGAIISGLVAIRKGILAAALATNIWTASLMLNPITVLPSLIIKAVAAIAILVGSFWGLSKAMDSNAEALDAEAEKAKKAQDELNELNKVAGELDNISKLTTEMNELGFSLDSLMLAKDFGKNAKEVEAFYKTLQMQEGLDLLSPDDLIIQADQLGKLLDMVVEPSIEGVASALGRLTATEQMWQDGMAAATSQLGILEKAQMDAAISREKLIVSSTGTNDDVKYFEAVTAKVMEYEAAQKLTNDSILEQAESVRKYRAAMVAAYVDNKMVTDQEKERTEATKASTKSIEILRKAEVKLSNLRERLAAAKLGEDALKFYDKVTKGVRAHEESIRDAIMTDEARAASIAAVTKRLTEQYTAEQAIAAAIKAATAAERLRKKAIADADRATKKSIEGIGKANDKLDLMRARMVALREGPGSFEVFNEVTAKVEAFRLALISSGVALAHIPDLMAEFQDLVEKDAAFQKWVDEADRFASAGASAFASWIDGTKSFRAAFHGMAMSILSDIIQMIAKQIILNAVMGLLGGFNIGGMGGGGGGGSAAFNRVGSFGPPMAEGGTVSPYSQQLVGEDGPEILRMGARGGRVIPNNEIGGGGGTVVVNIDAREQDDPARILSLIPLIQNQVEQGIKLKLSRGYL